jgi:hypothetical protein
LNESVEQPQQFANNSDFWIGEIRGNLARLNDAAAVVEIDIVIPMPTNDVQTTGHKVEKFRTFQFEFRRLYKNAKQVIPTEIKDKIEKWFEDTAKENIITDIVSLKYGIQLSDNLQDVLFDIGVKDIDVADPEMFPYEYYKELYDASS